MGWIIVLAAALLYGVMSLITFGVFALDKLRAKVDARRTPEKTLHVLSACGGFPGALVAMAVVRHKNRKPGFVAITLLIGLGHALAWVFLVVAWWMLK